jgi:uridine kinase
METADIMFNTHLAYELCVLRTSAQVMLELVPPSLPAWDTAQSLIKILNEFPPMSDEIVPGNSILREFIGNSLFNY